MKKCPDCGETNLASFGKDRHRLHGLATYCKACRAAWYKRTYIPKPKQPPKGRDKAKVNAWISQNWRGKPGVRYAVILKLIPATTIEAGLRVQCRLDTNSYLVGREVSDEEMATLSVLPDLFQSAWNYTIQPWATHIGTIFL